MRRSSAAAGFTLIEVLIALAITAFIAAIAYSSLSTALQAVETTRATAQRSYEVNRAWMIISRDLRQFVARPVRDEFGQVEPAITGGTAARFPLSFTRTGWHNPNDSQRSNLQRVNYRVEDGALWRDAYTVLDRAPDTAPRQVRLLEGVEVRGTGFSRLPVRCPLGWPGYRTGNPELAGQLGVRHQRAGQRIAAAGCAGVPVAA